MPGGKNYWRVDVTAGLVLAVGCDGSSDMSSGHPASAAGLAAATKNFGTKLLKRGFAGARRYLTRNCRDRVSAKGLAAAVTLRSRTWRPRVERVRLGLPDYGGLATASALALSSRYWAKHNSSSPPVKEHVFSGPPPGASAMGG